MPEPLEPVVPKKVQIANRYREAIQRGEYRPGDRLPARTEMAAEFGVNPNTVGEAMSLLKTEGVISIDNTGSHVADGSRAARTPSERSRALEAAGHRQAGEDPESIEVREAGIVTAKPYVADLLGIEQGAQVIRREEVTWRNQAPVMLSVDWIATGGVMGGAELTSPEPIEGGAIALVMRLTGRKIQHGQDWLTGRAADEREAGALGLEVGSPILAGTHIWSDDEGGVLLYGEWVLAPQQTVSYQYA